MCGILAILGLIEDAKLFRHTALKLSKRLRHRGPDWNGIYSEGHNILAHERLAIIDVVSGAQPLYNSDRSLVMAVNGEIYNHEALRKPLEGKYRFSSRSDCEVILHLYEDCRGPEFIDRLRGMFSFVIFDQYNNKYLAARDHIGIIPFYIGWGNDGSVWFASELKALSDHCKEFRQFPPGHFYDSSAKGDKIQRWYKPDWLLPAHIPSQELSLDSLRESFIKAVESHLMSDVPYGVLLSGGLDSSLVASIANRFVHKELHNLKDIPKTLRLRSFSVGLKGSPDLQAARGVAEFLGTNHYEFTFKIQDGLDALSDVIYHLETFDVTTVRASTPMYLMARLIKATGVKMVLSGEGADEIFGGYLYFHKAPNKSEFHEETVRKLQDLHMYDCLRANKSTNAWGVEARVPFLDRDFLQVAMKMDPKYKVARDPSTGEPRMEKWVLRKAFDTPENPYLPSDVLWRQKEQFSDGVGYSWIDSLKDYAELHITDAMMDTARFRFPEATPPTKEAYLYRQIFESHFPQPAAVKTVPSGPSIACSTATAIKWDKSFQNRADPSGRAITGIHEHAYSADEATTVAEPAS